MKKCLIAVASTDGEIVNQHFGHAERFLIYRVNGETIEFVEERTVSKYCLGIDTHSHPFEEDRFMAVANIIRDCRFVFVSKVGDTPGKRLESLGIIPTIAYGPIEECIRQALTAKEQV